MSKRENHVAKASQRAEELGVLRKRAIVKIVIWGVLSFLDFFIGLFVFYQDKALGLEPTFWVIYLGIMVICFIGEYRSYKSYDVLNEDFKETRDKLERLGVKFK